jgi:hypothetical protein
MRQALIVLASHAASGDTGDVAYAYATTGLNLRKGGSFQSEHILQQGVEAFSMRQSPNERPSIFTRTEITPWSGKQTNFLFDVLI